MVFFIVNEFVDLLANFLILLEENKQLQKLEELEVKYKDRQYALKIVEKNFKDLKEAKSLMESEMILVDLPKCHVFVFY
jgi:type II secretory pathway component PulL